MISRVRAGLKARCLIGVLSATVATVVLMAGTGGLDRAHAEGQDTGRFFDRVDANGDGAISRDEMREARIRAHARMDGDGDGAVTEAEMRALIEERRGATASERASRRFSRVDADGNGRVSIDEFTSLGEARFSRADTDGDGQITREEMQALRNRAGGQ